MSSGWSEVLVALTWAGALVLIVLPVVLYFARPARKALNSIAADHTTSDEERAANLRAKLIKLEERQHELSINEGTLPEQIEARKAQLRAQAAQSQTDAIAAENTIPAATEALSRVIAARAEAEVALAPDFVRGQWPTHDTSDGMKALGKAYETYCESVHPTESPLPFGSWMSGFRGLAS
jgi:hypothetical protein